MGAMSPERDIVTVVSATPVPDSGMVPGLLAGQRITNDLRGALELVRGGVPEAASPGLESLLARLRRLLAGDGPAASLPASYRSNGELWLPVQAQSLQVRLDAPDLLPRPRPGHAGGKIGNLPARARRIDWLPVGRTIRLVAAARHGLHTGKPGRERAQRLLAAALRLPHSDLTLEHGTLISAYYDVENALAVAPRWDRAIRDRLRRAAEDLDDKDADSGLAQRLQAQADRLTPDFRQLQDLAVAMRKQIVLTAGPRCGPTSPTTWSASCRRPGCARRC
jgi:hypothetical protein